MRKSITFGIMALLLVAFLAGCAGPAGEEAEVTAPTVLSVSPLDAAIGASRSGNLSVTFSEAMDAATLTDASFTLAAGATAVPGIVSMDLGGTIAAFDPTSDLASGTLYTATITTGAKDAEGSALEANYVWTFTTSTVAARGPARVPLATSGNYVILAKSAVSTTGTTAVTGHIAVSPAATSFLTGFSLTNDSTNKFATSSFVTGRLYAANMTPPTPDTLTTAVSDMQLAYTDAAGRITPDYLNLGAGNITGLTLEPGLYNWSTDLMASAGVTISGAADDIWIFQVTGNLNIGNGVIFTLAGGAQAKNIFWQVAGQTTLGTTADFKGIILCQTAIVMQTGAVLNGRALAQTQVTLDANAVTQPTL
ncbi:MAG: ice-binding family protein [Rectinemataceae bacterium]|nr:ice-binding family protein [Rectinemataceae bacterium]